MRLYNVLPAFFFLVSCQTTTVQSGNVAVQYSNSPAIINPGYKLQLNKAIVIPGESASLHIQDGEPRTQPLNPVENYRPYCIIEVRDRMAATQTIHPDVFKVTRVVRNEEIVSLIPRLASVDMIAANTGFHMGSGGHTAVVYATEMYLESSTQPNVTKLVCQQWDDATVGTHLNLNDIKLALGDLITVQPESAQ